VVAAKQLADAPLFVEEKEDDEDELDDAQGAGAISKKQQLRQVRKNLRAGLKAMLAKLGRLLMFEGFMHVLSRFKGAPMHEELQAVWEVSRGSYHSFQRQCGVMTTAMVEIFRCLKEPGSSEEGQGSRATAAVAGIFKGFLAGLCQLDSGDDASEQIRKFHDCNAHAHQGKACTSLAAAATLELEKMGLPPSKNKDAPAAFLTCSLFMHNSAAVLVRAFHGGLTPEECKDQVQVIKDLMRFMDVDAWRELQLTGEPKVVDRNDPKSAWKRWGCHTAVHKNGAGEVLYQLCRLSLLDLRRVQQHIIQRVATLPAHSEDELNDGEALGSQQPLRRRVRVRPDSTPKESAEANQRLPPTPLAIIRRAAANPDSPDDLMEYQLPRTARDSSFQTALTPVNVFSSILPQLHPGETHRLQFIHCYEDNPLKWHLALGICDTFIPGVLWAMAHVAAVHECLFEPYTQIWLALVSMTPDAVAALAPDVAKATRPNLKTIIPLSWLKW
jgi:hypothetical protein